MQAFACVGVASLLDRGMSDAGAQFVVDPPSGGVARLRTAIERICPTVVGLGLLLIIAAFALIGRAILRDYELRVNGLWNGVTGTPHGIAMHYSNKATAEFAEDSIKILTAVVGLSLAIPRRSESALFRWMGWMAFVLAVVLGAASVVGFLGPFLRWIYINQNCLIDGSCRESTKAWAPAEWRVHYIRLLMVAAASVSAVLSACVGVRWILSTCLRVGRILSTLLRKTRSRP